MLDLTVLIPTIRTHLLPRVVESLKLSCKRYEYDILLVGPFYPSTIPEEIRSQKVKYIKEYGCPSRSVQMALRYVEAPLFFHTTDDGVFFEDAIDLALDDYFKLCRKQDWMFCRYCEGKNMSGRGMDMSYWRAGTSYPGWPGINPDFQINCQFIINRDYFRELGGLDCRYEYLNFGVHQTEIISQKLGSKVYHSPTNVGNFDWYEGESMDHKPVNDSQLFHDAPLFHKMWYNGNNITKIDIDNWKQAEEVWSRRFGDKKPNEYRELGYT